MVLQKNKKIKVFDYIKELDCFKPTKEYLRIAKKLGIIEWNSVVWIGRYFTLDNDYGEHWFDNWEEREELKKEAKKYGCDVNELLIIVPERFKNNNDGPVHPAELRKAFWRDVLSSLELSLDTIFKEARFLNKRTQEYDLSEDYITDLEKRIKSIKLEYSLKTKKEK